MSKISELVKELRWIAEHEYQSRNSEGTIRKAADTIEMLSEKARADRPQGEWIDKGWHGDWHFEIDGRGNCWEEFECSNCNCHARYITPFCPQCGARMRG